MSKNDKPSSDPKVAVQQILDSIKPAVQAEMEALAAARNALAAMEGKAGAHIERAEGLRGKALSLKNKIASALARDEDPLPAARELRTAETDLADLETLVPDVHHQKLLELRAAEKEAEQALYDAARRALNSAEACRSYSQQFNELLAEAVALQEAFGEGLRQTGRELGLKRHNLTNHTPISALRCTDRQVGRALERTPGIA
ncbi:MAG: hypothetical protein ABIK12_00405 [Pseudomonadota bacterium]